MIAAILERRVIEKILTHLTSACAPGAHQADCLASASTVAEGETSSAADGAVTGIGTTLMP